MLAPLAALATGILTSRLVSFEVRELTAVIAAYGILALICVYRRFELGAACSALLAFVAAGALLDVAHRPGPPPEVDAEGRAPVILSGCVVEPSAISADRDQFTLELEPGARVRVNLYVREGGPAPVLRYGQRVELDARIRPIHNFNNPGAFDYAHFLARQDIYWTASARAGAPIRTMPGWCGSRFMGWIYAMRTAALDRLEELYQGRPYETGMMQSILIGENSKLDRVWTEEFRSTGTFHALVISGMHIAVLAGFFLFLLRLCFLPQGAATLVTMLACWLYALVTGWQVPAIRAAAGLTMFAIGRYFYRECRVLNLLAAIAIAFLVLEPDQMFDVSFQLSFLAVGFIGAFVAPLVERTSGPLAHALTDLNDAGLDVHLTPQVAQFRLEMRLLVETVHMWTRLPKKIAAPGIAIPARVALYFGELTLTSAMIQLGMALPMAAYFHRVSFSGFSANAVIVPLLSVAVPVGFVAVFTGWAIPAKAAGWLLACSHQTAAWHASWEPNWRLPDPPAWLAVGISAAMVAAGLLVRAGDRPVWRVLRVAAVSALGALLGIMVWYPFTPQVAPKQLEMTAIDVGQGDSIFLALPGGKLVLMDAGGVPSFGKRARTRLDIGEGVVSPYLWSRSIRSLDVVALSHAHADHIGGLASVIANFHVRELWTGATPGDPAWIDLRDRILRAGVKIVPLTQGMQFQYGGAQFEVLAPAADYVPAPTARNNDSLVLRLTYGERSMILSGDAERQVESDLVAANLARHADVLKVAHHGSRTSTTQPFLDAVHPAFGVISAGFDNLYGHPNAEVVERLESAHAAVLRTDRMGAVTVRTDGRRVEVVTASGGS